jgi:tetratricopeptide (TPR) repeat protein
MAKPHFEIVMRNVSVRHADDAAYLLGWFEFHQGQTVAALAYLSQALVVGNGDYWRWAALKQLVRILERFPPREQLTMVESSQVFAKQPALWYVAARSAYRDYDYELAIDAAKRALNAMGIPLDRLPATTDPKSIETALEKISPELARDENANEIPYLLEASREISQYANSLKSISPERPDALARRARAIIIKYSKLIDEYGSPGGRGAPSELSHRDLRQSLHLIDTTLEHVPKSAQYARLREWLHYRKVRVLVTFDPKTVPDAIAAMERDYPNSALLDDALAEQIYAQGLRLRDVSAAQDTFRRLVDNFPRGNAVDNGYTWMAIIYRCEKRFDDALNMNREIIRRFPATRHAMYARERMARPEGCGIYYR